MAVLGQHFLRDAHYLEQILQSIPYEHFKNRVQLVEVGVGLGDLTTGLLGRLAPSKSLSAYEVDRRLAEKLRDRLGSSLLERLELVVGDVMEHKRIEDGSQDRGDGVESFGGVVLGLPRLGFLCQRPYFLVSNLPYYIATPIITQALRDSLCLGMVVMAQLEVALKFCARVCSGDYGALSVLCSSVCHERSLLFEVPKNAFSPPPKVQSALIRLIKAPLCSRGSKVLGLRVLENVLSICFKASRKTLHNNLKSAYPLEWIQAFFKCHNLNPALRPHQLSPTHYISLAYLSQDITMTGKHHA